MASHRHRKDAVHKTSAERPPRKRPVYILAIPYVAVLVLLWLVNLALPLLDASLDIPFTHDIQLDGTTYREINRKYLEPFFPAGSPLIPELKNTLLSPAKPHNSVRVLCLGESSMFGVPYAFAATIPTLVRKQLRHLYPGMDIEVVNLGASAINTNVIRAMVPQFLSLEPDLVLVYIGHNEFYGPEGIGVSWIERQIPGLVPLKYRLRRLPIAVLLQRWLARFTNKQSVDERNLMRQVSAGAQVELNSPESQRIFSRFEDNLRDIVHGFRARGVPVILADISSSLMFPPFAPHPDDQSDPIPPAMSSGRFSAADSLVAAGLARDSSNAYFLYWRGRLSLAAGDSGGALRFLERARDNDLLKFRAPGRINEIIHEVGTAESVPVLPVDSLLRARSPHGITDTTFFTEHLHPTFAGYDLIARAFVHAIIDKRIVFSASGHAASLLPFNADSLSVPRLDLEYGALSLRALTSRWPFTGMPPRHDILDSCEPWEREIAEGVYGGKIGWTDALLRYAQEAKDHKRPDAMLTAFAALVEEYPGRAGLQYGLAAALENAGRIPEAIDHYRRAIAINPEVQQPRVDFAFLLIDHAQYAEAQRQLLDVVSASAAGTASTEPRVMALYGLAVIAANRDSLRSALTLLDEALRLAPGYQAALSLRSEIQGNARR